LCFRIVYRKDEFTMKKLLALFIIGGLLSTITGCPPAGTTGVTKREMPQGGMKTKEMKSGRPETKPEEKKKDEEKKSEEKKTEEKKSDGGTKVEEKKTEEKKK
jgi:hypothetical protein